MVPEHLLYRLILGVLTFSRALGACNRPSALDVTTPGRLQALKGSCVHIPCNFTPVLRPGQIFNVSKSVIGVWIISDDNFVKHPENLIYNSSFPYNKYPMNITGDLRKRDCTTLFHNLTTEYSNTYFFRVENRPYAATDICKTLQITVTDSPQRPFLEVSGDQTDSEEVTITCSALTPCPLAPPHLTWDLHQGTVNIKETNSDGTFNTTIKLTLTLTDAHDEKAIKCTAVYPVSGGVKTADSSLTLSVRYGPKDTSVQVSPSGSLSAGQSVTLSCSSRANPPVQTFSWFKHSSERPDSVSEGQNYTFILIENGEFYCEASNALRSESSPVIRLQISENESSAVIYIYNILQLCCILLLYSSLAIFECWFRATHGKKPETQTPEPTYVNCVMETQT